MNLDGECIVCFLSVHYNGYLEFADEPFDSTRLRGKPLGYLLGSGKICVSQMATVLLGCYLMNRI